MIDPVLDYDHRSGKVSTAGADQVLAAAPAQALEVACVLAEGQGWIDLTHLHLPNVAVAPVATTAVAGSTLRQQNRQQVQQTLSQCGGNVSEAARRLGISRTTLYRALREEE